MEWDPRNANTVTVIGNTGMDPEMTMFDTGACVARVSLAVRGKKPMSPGGMDPAGASNADDGATTWLDVEAWNDEARQLCDHVAKGRQIMVTGRLKENVWTDKATGQRRSRIKVSAYSFAFVAPYNGANGVNGGGVNEGAYRPDDPYANQAVAATMPRPQQQQQRMQQQRQASATMMGGDVVGEKDDLWREVLDNPDAWWDNRERKARRGVIRYPDFKHKDTQTPLWIEIQGHAAVGDRRPGRWRRRRRRTDGGGSVGSSRPAGDRTRTASSRITPAAVPCPAAAAATATSRVLPPAEASITRDRTGTSRTNPRSPSTTTNPRSDRSTTTLIDDGSKDDDRLCVWGTSRRTSSLTNLFLKF